MTRTSLLLFVCLLGACTGPAAEDDASGEDAAAPPSDGGAAIDARPTEDGGADTGPSVAIAVEDLSFTTLVDTPVGGVLRTTVNTTGESPRFVIADPPARGSVTLDDAATGAFTYTPEAGAFGRETFTYLAIAGGLSSSAGTVSVRVDTAEADHLELTGPGYETVGRCVPITVARFGDADRLADALVLDLSASGAEVRDESCAPITSLTIPAGATSASFALYSTVAGVARLDVTDPAGAYDPAELTLELAPDVITTLVQSGPTAVTRGPCYAYRVVGRDRFGNEARNFPTSFVRLPLAPPPSYRDAACTMSFSSDGFYTYSYESTLPAGGLDFYRVFTTAGRFIHAVGGDEAGVTSNELIITVE